MATEFRTPSDDDEETVVPVISWPDALEYLDEHWHPGMHVSIFAPTGRGKTYLIMEGLMRLWTRSRVLIIDVKRDRGTMAPYGHVVQRYPTLSQKLPFMVRQHTRDGDHESWDNDPEWYKLQPEDYRWSPDKKRADAPTLRTRADVGRALDKAFHEGNWTIVLDEVHTLQREESPGLDLGNLLARIWEEGRDRDITIIAGTQQPVDAPSQMYDQPSFVFLGRMKDVRRQMRMGEIGGARDLVMDILPELEGHEFLMLDLVNDEVFIVEVDSE
jgi:hypothetical protein